MCLKEIRRCAQNMITILSLIINIIEGGPVWPFNEHENRRFNKIFIGFQFFLGKWLWLQFGFANHLVVMVCFIS